MTDSFPKFIGTSVMLHISIVLLFTMRALMFPSQPLELRHAIRVDVVGLPDKIQTLPAKEISKPAPVPVAQEKPKPLPPQAKPKEPAKPKVDLSKKPKVDVSKTEKSALEKIKAMEAIEKFKGEVTSYSKAKPVRGNVVANGDSLDGDQKADMDKYFSQIEDRIRQNWSLPQWLADAHLRAQALVLIDSAGMVRKKQIVKSSGNGEFDSRMMDAIDKSSPFPAPPDKLRDILSVKGIIFNFPQRGDS